MPDLSGWDGVVVLAIAGAVVGLVGRIWRPIRLVLVGMAPLGSAAIILYFVVEGSASQCDGVGATFHCWEVSYASALLGNGFGAAGVAIATVLSLTPIASAYLGRPAPSVFAAYVMPLVIFVFFIFVAPWVYVWPALLAAAIAGPPRRRLRPDDPVKPPLEEPLKVQ